MLQDVDPREYDELRRDFADLENTCESFLNKMRQARAERDAALGRIAELQGRRCETCAHWDWREECAQSTYGDRPLTAGADVWRGVRTKPDFGCNQWEPKL